MLMSALSFSVASSNIKMSTNPQYVKVFHKKNGMHICNTWVVRADNNLQLFDAFSINADIINY